LTAAEVARGKLSLSEIQSDGEALYWLEARPSEGGRVVLVRAGPDGRLEDHSPPDVSIRSRVHEYGGGAVALVPGWGPGAFAYVNLADQRVWLCDGDGDGDGDGTREHTRPAPRPLTPPPPTGTKWRHGGLGASPDGDWVLAVRECERDGAPAPVRSIVALSTRHSRPTESTLLAGHDFFGAPRVAPEGTRLAAVVCDHPDMPWDASSVVVLELGVDEAGLLVARGAPAYVAGGPDESVGQPAWQRDGSLRFVSDRHGWWQPCRLAGDPGTDPGPQRLTDAEAEFHGPDWVLGQATMAELADGTLVARMTADGRDALVALAPGASPSQPPRLLEQPCVSISGLCAHGAGFALIGATPDAPVNAWVTLPEVPTRPVRPPSGALSLRARDVARGEPFALTGRSGRPVHGILYRPQRAGATKNPGGAGRPPPLVAWCHSGPTSSCQAGLDPTLQFFTSRGFAVACVDYAGSSGYGRAYRCALWGRWGVADAEDVLDAALHLAARGDVDGARLAARGGSAGGMTALNALAAGEGFAACAASYGVTDLLGLAATTHDFEAHYTDRLIGPLPGARMLYEERSPINRAAAMTGAVLLLQGTEDPVVPPAQAERMRDALVAAGVPCDLRFFEGEGHGFRRAETLTACLEAECAFYLSVLRL
jgi:dipeptidyl aminopeptidase/acylaminoacyl peptidase